MQELPKHYDAPKSEEKWSKYWQEEEIYKFKESKNNFVIDTPPPFPSGDPHMGHVLWWTWNDIISRFKRMRGFSVLLPQGWDTHGLPTELAVEKKYKLRKNERTEFLKACKELTSQNIAKMKSYMGKMGYSADWSHEYNTDTPEYTAFVQKTLLNLFNKGLIERRDHPGMWCTKCQTTVAKAEVGYKEHDSTLYHLRFPVVGEKKHITIATTRPEMLPACVTIFVHPDDQRYKSLIGKRVLIPIVNREVEILPNGEVDQEFGTGAVYLCTFGDEADVKWQMKFKLPSITILDQYGKMTTGAGEFAGMKIVEARGAIVNKLGSLGIIEKEEKFKHNVLCHTERSSCLNPIELLPLKQWQIRVTQFNKELLKALDDHKLKWSPEHMQTRLRNWIESMDREWTISRQRVFGTPIPFWYCLDCGHIIAPKEKDLPVDPATQASPVKKCVKCNSNNIQGEKDVCDGWIDSSITPLVVSGYWKNPKTKIYPTSLRQQGHDILRTWAYYTALRCWLETGKIPWNQILVNSMVLGPDGREMHKSLGNTILPDDILPKHGADAVRATMILLGAFGKDAPFDWKHLEFARKFMTKYWNIFKFVAMNVSEKQAKPKELKPLDKWILTKLQHCIEGATEDLESFQFNSGFTKMHQFIWSEFADNYLEAVKHRLQDKDKAAQWTLYTVLETTLRMLAPLLPFYTEEIYQVYLRQNEKKKSVHQLAWPEADKKLMSEPYERLGEIFVLLVSSLRQHKNERGLSLVTELPKVTINCEKDLVKYMHEIADDLKGTMKIKELIIAEGKDGKQMDQMPIFLKVE